MTKGSTIDLVFTSIGLNNQYIEWKVAEDIASGSDHEILLFSIIGSKNLINNLTHSIPYNLEKANWKEFSIKILEIEKYSKFQWKY